MSTEGFHRRVTAVVAALLLLVAVVACGDSADEEIVLGEDDIGTAVELETGERARIRLPSNPSTGYRWVIAMESNTAPVLLLDDWHESADSDLVGAAGTDVFRIEATSAGPGVLRLEYRRPFEASLPAERVAEFIIIVDGAAWPPEDRPRPGTTSDVAPPPDDG